MRSLTARLEALEKLWAGSGCTCQEVIVLHEHVTRPLSEPDMERELTALPPCPVHGRKPASLVIVIRDFAGDPRA
jgi:hypothetical protein